mgnify:FL=1|tara:strand:+ start:649 stop:1062 length:414 start_codon:yes stop_codon:yes gene_type:complete
MINELVKIHLSEFNRLAKLYCDEIGMMTSDEFDDELLLGASNSEYQLGTSEFITNYLKDKYLYIENDYLYYHYNFMSDWVFITQLVQESFDGSLSDTNIYRDVLGLSGDDDSDYNNSYIHAFIYTIDYLETNKLITK